MHIDVEHAGHGHVVLGITAYQLHVLHCALHAYVEELAESKPSSSRVGQRLAATLRVAREDAASMAETLAAVCDDQYGHDPAKA